MRFAANRNRKEDMPVELSLEKRKGRCLKEKGQDDFGRKGQKDDFDGNRWNTVSPLPSQPLKDSFIPPVHMHSC